MILPRGGTHPKLVTDLIVWYRWKGQINRVMDELKREFVVEDDGGLSYSLFLESFVKGEQNPDVIWKKRLNYRHLDNPIVNYYDSYYINNFAKRRRRGWSVDQLTRYNMVNFYRYQIQIPQRYCVSSGFSNKINGHYYYRDIIDSRILTS